MGGIEVEDPELAEAIRLSLLDGQAEQPQQPAAQQQQDPSNK